jgi:5-hydroxyisourate hydrolase
MTISTHILDLASGLPAAGVRVTLSMQDKGHWTEKASAATDHDGRCRSLLENASPGTYRLHFDTAAYFERTGQDGFFPEVSITFLLGDTGHVHVPLLLSPFAYSTYRGS